MKTADSQSPVGTTHLLHKASRTHPRPTPHRGEEPVPFQGRRGQAGQDTWEDQGSLAGRLGERRGYSAGRMRTFAQVQNK